jgi:diaminohydroxyphosphoribosylaminopyrimidine deaminase / 5-amino-6-(5-phosphoribosylamino)uracil reductase
VLAALGLYDFPADLRDEIAIDNAAFLARYKTKSGDFGEVEFDYALNGRSFALDTSAGAFTIQVSDMGLIGVYVYDYSHNVAHARYATEFAQIDDPGALEFGSYYAPLHVNEIACYRSKNGYLLVKLTGVDRSRGRHGVKFSYEARGKPRE